jgi:hypothetical protein
MFRTHSRNADPPPASANSGQDSNDINPANSSEDEIPDPAEALNLGFETKTLRSGSKDLIELLTQMVGEESIKLG